MLKIKLKITLRITEKWRLTDFERDLWFPWLVFLQNGNRFIILFLTKFNIQSLEKFRSHKKLEIKIIWLQMPPLLQFGECVTGLPILPSAFFLSSCLEHRPRSWGAQASLSWGDKDEDNSLLSNAGGMKRETAWVFNDTTELSSVLNCYPQSSFWQARIYLSSCKLGLLLWADEVIPKWYQIMLIFSKRLVNCPQAIYWEFKIHIYPPLILNMCVSHANS